MVKTVSILGSGWLGLPLAQYFVSLGHMVKASTRSEKRAADIRAIGADPFIVNVDTLTGNIQQFLQANILIVNIPSKNITGFHSLVKEIATSDIENVLYVSSTSVYENTNKTITESDDVCFSKHPMLAIEGLFKRNTGFNTTIVRFGGLIGHSRHPGRFFGPGRLVRNPESPVNLIHQEDCIGIISQIVEQDVWGEVFNCCADTHPSKREFYTQAAELTDGTAPEFETSGSVSFKIISNQKVKQSLGYVFKHPDLMKIEF